MKKHFLFIVFIITFFIGNISMYSQLDPLPGDPLPGDPDPGIEVPLDGGLLLGLFGVSTVVVGFFAKKKKSVKN
jgi:hypothetical protein